jgi:hypothetical protein
MGAESIAELSVFRVRMLRGRALQWHECWLWPLAKIDFLCPVPWAMPMAMLREAFGQRGDVGRRRML